MDPNRKRDIADRVDAASSVTAGSIGAGFAAGKLRDAFKEEHPKAFKSGVTRTHAQLRAHGVRPATARRITGFLAESKPKFLQGAIAGGATAVAAGAGHYSSHVKRAQANAARRERDAAARASAAKEGTVTKSAFGVVHPITKSDIGDQADALKAKLHDADAKAARKAAKKAAREQVAAAAPERVAEHVNEPVGMWLRPRKANPSMPKVEHMFDELRRAHAGPSTLGRHLPTAAAVGAGVTAGVLIHHRRKAVAKSAGANVNVPFAGRLPSREAMRASAVAGTRKAGRLIGTAATEHGKYIAGAAGVGSAGAIGGVLANRARKAAPAKFDAKIAAKFPLPKAGPALAAGAAGVATAGVLAHERHKKQSLTKSAFGVEHPEREAVVLYLPVGLRKAGPRTQPFDETGSLR